MQQPPSVETISKGVGLALSFAGLGTVIVKIFSWLKRRWNAKKAIQQEQLDILKKLRTGQDELDSRLDGLGKRMDAMDKSRQEARKEDAHVRTRLYLGTVAIVDAVMKVAEHQGLAINGEVAAYRRDNIENLKNGVGIAPLQAYKPENMEG